MKLEEKSEDIMSKEYSFVINIISNWGNKKKVGMTEIELFDQNNKKIKINNIKIKGIEEIIVVKIQINYIIIKYILLMKMTCGL